MSAPSSSPKADDRRSASARNRLSASTASTADPIWPTPASPGSARPTFHSSMSLVIRTWSAPLAGMPTRGSPWRKVRMVVPWPPCPTTRLERSIKAS